MKNILNSKIVVSGARSHWTGDHNGTLVTPKIEIYGLTEEGQPYGYISAEISRSTTDGGASSTLWSMDVPFGRYTRNAYDKIKFVGNDGNVYDSAYKCDPNNKNSVTTLKEILYTPVQISDKWEVIKSSPRGWGIDKELCDAAGIYPQCYSVSFKGFPTLEEIDAKWDRIVAIGGKCLSVKNDFVVVKTNDDNYVLFSEI